MFCPKRVAFSFIRAVVQRPLPPAIPKGPKSSCGKPQSSNLLGNENRAASPGTAENPRSRGQAAGNRSRGRCR